MSEIGQDVDGSEPLSDPGSSSEFDDQDGEELFDIFTGEVAEARNGEDYLATLERETAAWQEWIPLRGSTDIRLIDIDTEGSSELLRCRMRTTSLEDPCEYHTLSYAWGDSKDDGSHLTHVIECDGHAFRITKSLHDALTRIRSLCTTLTGRSDSKLQPLPVWCDAICINQKNDFERSSQVMMMHRIYRSSRHLLIWLGTEVATQVDSLYEMALDKLPSFEISCLVMRVLLYSPWFHRRWVIQEAASQPTSSSSILSTKGLLSVQTMQVWIGYVEGSGYYGNRVGNVESSYLNQRQHHGNPMHQRTPCPLILNLYWYRDACCSDNRDRVYALRSVSSDAGDLVVDYRKSAAEVYCAVAALSAKSGLVVEVLVFAVLRRARATDDRPSFPMSSWIPDWSDQGLSTPVDNTEVSDPYLSLGQWGKRLERFKRHGAGRCIVFRDPMDGPNIWRLAITGWLFQPCRCATSASSVDCLQCLLSRHSAANDFPWLRNIGQQTVLVLEFSQVLIVLKPVSHGLYELKSCMRKPGGHDVPRIIREDCITESGDGRKLEKVVLI